MDLIEEYWLPRMSSYTGATTVPSLEAYAESKRLTVAVWTNGISPKANNAPSQPFSRATALPVATDVLWPT